MDQPSASEYVLSTAITLVIAGSIAGIIALFIVPFNKWPAWAKAAWVWWYAPPPGPL